MFSREAQVSGIEIAGLFSSRRASGPARSLAAASGLNPGSQPEKTSISFCFSRAFVVLPISSALCAPFSGEHPSREGTILPWKPIPLDSKFFVYPCVTPVIIFFGCSVGFDTVFLIIVCTFLFSCSALLRGSPPWGPHGG